jgi:hypothetical protein
MDPEHDPAEWTEIFAEFDTPPAYEPRRAISTDRYKYTAASTAIPVRCWRIATAA